ncbi:28101_t:CDS:2, partial [Dentiscutata erythropus]
MLDTQDNDFEVPKKESKLQKLIRQISNRPYREIQSEIRKTLKYDLPKGLVEYLCLYDDVEFTTERISNKESISNFTWNTFNLIDDTPIERWESDSVSENLLLNFTDENEGNTILFPTEDLVDLPW